MDRGYTTIEENNVAYEWEIDKMDFFLNSKNSFTLTSPNFTSGSQIQDTWRLKSIFDSEDDVNFYLCLTSDHHKLNTKFYLFFFDSKKNKIVSKTTYYKSFSKGEESNLSISKKNLLGNEDTYLSDNTFTVGINLTVYGVITTATKVLSNIPKHQMAHDYTELYNSKISSDVIINVGEKEFQAHKIILMARSPVLAAIFSHEMIEKKDKKLTIRDISPEIFEKVLEYIYTDKVTGLEEIADDLLEAADKYQLLSLKIICQESLSETLTVENALKIMTLADRHSAKHLLEFTNTLMASNIKQIIETQNFKEFKKSNPSSALAIMEKFIVCNKGD
ncbi:speckle-type POZ protein-like [Microplitis mediator]|uniref:speckle-type POZ protein-like n=1 Tax=Microplitis mediator TaxID=375433 RepID=UPI002555873D|nr:speckle-type POZ protein-like [Microplitis mediator]